MSPHLQTDPLSPIREPPLGPSPVNGAKSRLRQKQIPGRHAQPLRRRDGEQETDIHLLACIGSGPARTPARAAGIMARLVLWMSGNPFGGTW